MPFRPSPHKVYFGSHPDRPLASSKRQTQNILSSRTSRRRAPCSTRRRPSTAPRCQHRRTVAPRQVRRTAVFIVGRMGMQRRWDLGDSRAKDHSWVVTKGSLRKSARREPRCKWTHFTRNPRNRLLTYSSFPYDSLTPMRRTDEGLHNAGPPTLGHFRDPGPRIASIADHVDHSKILTIAVC